MKAYWISNKGKIFELKENKTHISYVIKYPEKFGETKESIKNTYEKYDEQISWEGKAREEIIVRIIKRGYIRIREYRNRWSIQLNKLTQKNEDFIWGWAKTIYNDVKDKYNDVMIHELSTNKIKRTSFNKLIEDVEMKTLYNKYLKKLYESHSDKERVVFVESVNEFDDYIDLNEASLGRIYQHIQKKNIDSWGILTSWRAENDLATNKKNFKELKKSIRNLGLGFITLKAVGEEDSENGIVPVTELSLFVPNIKFKDIKNLSNKYNQWGFIYSGKETNDKIALISDKGKTVENIGSFHPNKISNFYSTIKGKPFVFEAILVESWMEGMYFSKLGNKNDKVVLLMSNFNYNG